MGRPQQTQKPRSPEFWISTPSGRADCLPKMAAVRREKKNVTSNSISVRRNQRRTVCTDALRIYP